MQTVGQHERGIVEQVVTAIWHTGVEALTPLGTGVYGRCYGVTLTRPPYRAAIKLHHVPGMAAEEAAQLRALRAHLPLPTLIPRVYACLTEADLEVEPPAGAVAMEWLPGQSCEFRACRALLAVQLRPGSLPSARDVLGRRLTES